MAFVQPLLLLFLACCGGGPSSVEAEHLAPPDPVAPPDPAAGRAAFLDSCAGCHMSRDGFDLAYFGFPDSTIIRRALRHVPVGTARDIAAHIRTLSVAPVGRRTALFQPGEAVLVDDQEFARRLFGADQWSADIDAERLRDLDTRSTSIALEMPAWSNEEDDFDWMPNQPLPHELLAAGGGSASRALEVYYGAPTLENLRGAVVSLRAAEEQDGPCMGRAKPVDPVACFEARRWVASLIAVHFLRNGTPRSVDRVFADAWWDVGDLSRRIAGFLPKGAPIATPWLYLGWSFGRTDRVLVYLTHQLETRDMPRLATFVAMRTMVDQSEGQAAPYRNLRGAVTAAPPHWAADVLHSGLNILLADVESGNGPGEMALGEAVEALAEAFQMAEYKAPGETAALEPLRQQLISRLGATAQAQELRLNRDPRRLEREARRQARIRERRRS